MMSDEFPRLGDVPDRIGWKTALAMLAIGIPLSIITLLVVISIWKPDSAAGSLVPFAIALGASWYLARWLAKGWRSGHRLPAIGCGVLLVTLYAPILVLVPIAVEK